MNDVCVQGNEKEPGLRNRSTEKGLLDEIDSKVESVAASHNSLTNNLDANLKIQRKLDELRSAKDDYFKFFLPEKEKAGKKLDDDLVHFERLYPANTSGMGCLIALIVVTGVVIAQTTANQVSPELPVLLEAVFIVVLMAKFFLYSSRKSARTKKKRELMHIWEKWNNDEEAHTIRIAELERDLRVAKSD